MKYGEQHICFARNVCAIYAIGRHDMGNIGSASRWLSAECLWMRASSAGAGGRRCERRSAIVRCVSAGGAAVVCVYERHLLLHVITAIIMPVTIRILAKQRTHTKAPK